VALSAARGQFRHFNENIVAVGRRGAIATVAITGRIKGVTDSERRRFIESRTGGA
jgi:hypothetical protein